MNKDLDKFPVLKKAVEHFKETGGRSEEDGCIPNFVYFFKQMNFRFDQDPDEMFGWDSETKEDFWSWGHNSRWAHTACMWIDDNFEECIEKAIELAKEYGDLDLEVE